MRVLVVFCHPTHESLTGAALARALAGLATGGHEVRVVDLYAEGFRPELSLDERAAHLVDHRLEPGLRAEVTPSVEALRWCQALVLVHPTWWSGQPAMLKGWFDRVWVRGVAWDLPDGSDRIRPMLRDLRRIVTVTSHGSSKIVNAVEGEAGKRIASRSLRAVCSRRCRVRWIALYGVDTSTPERRVAFLDRVERELELRPWWRRRRRPGSRSTPRRRPPRSSRRAARPGR